MPVQTQPKPKASDDVSVYLQEVDDSVRAFERDEQKRLQFTQDEKNHWYDANPTHFTAAQREHTTILHAGLTMAHDLFIQSAFRGLGYQVEAMDVPDNRALQYGREFGNRGQCNPTYFTVGNLVKKLKAMQASGISKKDIIEKYLFATAGSCGPCRFGTYVTEYRKALRDAGFEGFRVILFQQSGGAKQATGQELGLKINAQFFLTIAKAIIVGDALNALMYRVRPYEVEAGATDAAIERAKQRIAKSFETRRGFWRALWQTRRDFNAIEVDRTQVKPRVAIIGEFWAMTTEGDGNYKMQRFLEGEGAEVDIQLVTNWILYLLWSARYDTLERARLKGVDKGLADNGSKFALAGQSVAKKLWGLKAVEWYVRGSFYSYARVLGLKDYHLPDMDHIAEISHTFYDNNLRGGEGHMEVGKLIHNVVDQTVNMTLSIKPFGCMPSSSVSDGVQSIITELYPQAIFLPIETNGDGAVNVYSRVQMQLFKAKQAAQAQVDTALADWQLDSDRLAELAAARPQTQRALYRSKNTGACTALDLVNDLGERHQLGWRRPLAKLGRACKRVRGQGQRATIAAVRRAADQCRQNLSNRSLNAKTEAVRIVEP